MFKRIILGILFALLFVLGLWGATWVISLLLLTQPSDAVMTPAIIIGFFAVFILYLVKRVSARALPSPPVWLLQRES